MKIIITTISDPPENLVLAAHRISERLQAPYVKKENFSLADIKNTYFADTIVVITKQGLIAHTPGGEYFYHPHLALLRIQHLKAGQTDTMIKAMQVVKGMKVLDCTLGLGSDAAVASYVVGPSGAVVGLEHSPILAIIAELGMSRYQKDVEFSSIIKRIQVVQADYKKYLETVNDQSFDVVYFDPMFLHPIQSSSNMKPLRYLADSSGVDAYSINQALRVGKRVVIKDSSRGKLFDQLEITNRIGGKYSSVVYGVIEARRK